jgi:hypothetical protein
MGDSLLKINPNLTGFTRGFTHFLSRQDAKNAKGAKRRTSGCCMQDKREISRYAF